MGCYCECEHVSWEKTGRGGKENNRAWCWGKRFLLIVKTDQFSEKLLRRLLDLGKITTNIVLRADKFDGSI